jgi:ATP-binding cassette subfamily F protein 3
MTNTRIRNVLAAFLFTGEDVFKEIKDLSGGERGRVSLAKLMLSNANFLILDEPTNHLDITSKEILENALKNYTGTILYVSHDRYFINQTATRILDLTPNGITSYIGNYDYYIEQQLVSTSKVEEQAKIVKEDTENKKDWKRSKEEQAKERKRQNDIKKIEDRIAELEQLLSDLDAQMTLPEHATNAEKLTELSLKQAETNEELEQLYERWEELSEDS